MKPDTAQAGGFAAVAGFKMWHSLGIYINYTNGIFMSSGFSAAVLFLYIPILLFIINNCIFNTQIKWHWFK